MILRNELYTITSKEITDSKATFQLQLNANHFIYQAHFPGEPITPGVCIIQICKELLEEMTGSSLNIILIKNVKFLSVISPSEMSALTCQLTLKDTSEEQETIACTAAVKAGDATMSKLSFTCKKHHV